MDALFWSLGFVSEMLPCMGLVLVLYLALLPLRRRSLHQRGLVSGPAREGVLLLFLLFCGGLAALTLFPHNFWPYGFLGLLQGEQVLPAWSDTMEKLAWLPQNLIPLHEISRAGDSKWTMYLLLGNIGMFLPLGLGSALLWRNGSWRRALLVGLGGSCFIEFVQFFIGRSTDIDDVILNTIGALAGYGLYRLLNRLCPRLCRALQPGRRDAVHLT